MVVGGGGVMWDCTYMAHGWNLHRDTYWGNDSGIGLIGNDCVTAAVQQSIPISTHQNAHSMLSHCHVMLSRSRCHVNLHIEPCS